MSEPEPPDASIAPRRPFSPDQARAQLTFSFGITSLQLTPFSRLGSLDLERR